MKEIIYQATLPGALVEWKSPIRYRDTASPELKLARERAAQLYTPVLQIRMVRDRTIEQMTQVTSPKDAAEFLKTYYDGLTQEHMCVILLNTKSKIVAFVPVYIGSVHTSVVRIGEIFRPAILINASAIILAHNHPSGDPTPSPEDAAVTREVVKAGQLLDVDVLDHIVMGEGNKFVSLKERGLGF